MARPVTTLVVFFLLFNLWANLLIGTGAAQELGVDPEVGHDELVDQVESEQMPLGTGIGQTLFGLYNVLVQFVNTVFGFATAGVSMLGNAGVPSEYLTLLETLFGVLLVIDLVSFYKGWGL